MWCRDGRQVHLTGDRRRMSYKFQRLTVYNMALAYLGDVCDLLQRVADHRAAELVESAGASRYFHRAQHRRGINWPN